MNNHKDDVYYVEKIIASIEFIIKHIEGVSFQAFSEDEVLQDSMHFRMVQIHEHARNLTDAFKMKHDDIPWGDIAGLRNRIVHDYGSVDHKLVYDTLIEDIPALLESLKHDD